MRPKNLIQIKQHSTSFYKKHVLYNGSVFFNKLPESLQQERNIKTFKRSLRLYPAAENRVEEEVLDQKAA